MWSWGERRIKFTGSRPVSGYIRHCVPHPPRPRPRPHPNSNTPITFDHHIEMVPQTQTRRSHSVSVRLRPAQTSNKGRWFCVSITLVTVHSLCRRLGLFGNHTLLDRSCSYWSWGIAIFGNPIHRPWCGELCQFRTIQLVCFPRVQPFHLLYWSWLVVRLQLSHLDSTSVSFVKHNLRTNIFLISRTSCVERVS